MSNKWRILEILAIHIYKKDWKYLQDRLNNEYESYLKEGNYKATPLLERLLISGEDHRFFRHGGIDFKAVCRAIWRRIAKGIVEGASTIEMQTVRVLTGRYERTFRRKIREMLLASLVTKVIPKEEVPAIYLQIAYYGWRMDGLKQACKHLNKLPHNLSLEESAALVARIKYPEPKRNHVNRNQQINNRKRHLVMLYSKHLRTGVYSHSKEGPLYETI